MSVISESKEALAAPSTVGAELEERITSPVALRALHQRFCEDDRESSANRAAVKELMDFVPPYNQADLEARGMADRFNINFGLASALKNEAVGPFIDIFNSPSSIVKIVLDSGVDPYQREGWADIMSDEWTKMIRSWDVMSSNILQLVDLDVTHGVAIPWFEDESTLNHEISSLEDVHFDADAVAVPSLIEGMTISRTISLSRMFSHIDGKSGEWTGENDSEWNIPMAKRLIANAKPADSRAESWNYEEAARQVKACRLSGGVLPNIKVVWGVVKELDGRISVYACADSASLPEEQASGTQEEKWLYRKRFAYKDANRMFSIFTFSIGNKNRIYTIRGYGYMLYEAGQADNVLRCKMMDSARHRASEIYQPESKIDGLGDIQFIDLGHAMVCPPGLKGMPATNTQQLDRNIGFTLEANQDVMNKHGSGLSSSSLVNNPGGRRNELQVTAELEYTNKMQGFAISLFYAPYDKYIRELVRRSFNETQSDPFIRGMIERMKQACIDRGVPLEALGRIDLEATQAVRLQGAGSKGSRLISFQQLAELFSSMDPQGQEYFMYDFASEIKGRESAIRYFGIPGQRRGHVDIALARLENNDLLEGQLIEPVEGENSMVHLREHIDELIAGLAEVNEGSVDFVDWTLRNIPLYQHCVKTLEITSVHESQLPELNGIRQQVQQAGEVIQNGMRHINKMQDDQGDMSQGLAPNDAEAAAAAGQPMTGQPADGQSAGQSIQGMSPGDADNYMKMNRVFAEAHAKMLANQMVSKAKIDIMKQESMAKILTMSAETRAELRRKEILAKASNG